MRHGVKSSTFLAAAGVMLAGTLAQAAELTIAAGAGYRRPVSEIAAAFERGGSDRILQIYGNMGQIIGQARQSGRIAMLCGDASVLRRARGLAFERMVRLGAGRLVVAYRKGLSLQKAEDVAGDAFRRVGIPDQANAVYGKAGRQYLQRSGLASALDPRLIAVATVPQVMGYIASGEVDAGFTNATDAIGMKDRIGGFVTVDPKLYDEIEIACGILKDVPDRDLAGRFAKFIATDGARAILDRYGM